MTGILLLWMPAFLSGCEHTTGLQQPSRAIPEPQLVRSATGLEPAELATLLRMADRVEPTGLSGKPWGPSMAHPLDGLTPGQVQQLFSAAGLAADRYAAPWILPCDSCTNVSGAR
ncbi:MAG TPA: hypothetical protein VF006_13910 [Longimicrobium sp.]